MPIATKFEAEGVDNGFPECLQKVDVSLYNYDSAMTLAEVMSFYWNSYSVTMSAFYSATSPEIFNGDVSDPSVDDRLFNGADKNPPGYTVGDREPVKRVCSGIGTSYKRQEDSVSFNGVDVRFSGTPNPIRLYNGDTSDEGNFIGYGLDGEIASASAGEEGGSLGSRTSIYSYAELSSNPAGWWSGFSIMGTPDTVTSVTIGGIPLIKAVWTSFNIGDQATDITDIDFYTYP